MNIMQDGTEAYLTVSKKYYGRNGKNGSFLYYTLDGSPIPLAKAQCGKCAQVIERKRCGDFVMCECESSFVDTDRWAPEGHRIGGDAIDLN